MKNQLLSPNFDLARADLKNHFQISTIGSRASPDIGALIKGEAQNGFEILMFMPGA